MDIPEWYTYRQGVEKWIRKWFIIMPPNTPWYWEESNFSHIGVPQWWFTNFSTRRLNKVIKLIIKLERPPKFLELWAGAGGLLSAMHQINPSTEIHSMWVTPINPYLHLLDTLYWVQGQIKNLIDSNDIIKRLIDQYFIDNNITSSYLRENFHSKYVFNIVNPEFLIKLQ